MSMKQTNKQTNKQTKNIDVGRFLIGKAHIRTEAAMQVNKNTEARILIWYTNITETDLVLVIADYKTAHRWC